MADLEGADFKLAWARIVAQSVDDEAFRTRALAETVVVFAEHGFEASTDKLKKELGAYTAAHLQPAIDAVQQAASAHTGAARASAQMAGATPQNGGNMQASAAASMTGQTYYQGLPHYPGLPQLMCACNGSASSASTQCAATIACGGLPCWGAGAPVGPTTMAGGATGGGMSVNTMMPTGQDMRFNCVGSFGTVGSVGSWCGTAGSAATAGTFGSAVTANQSTMNAGTSGSFGSVGVTSTPLSGAAQIRSMAPGEQDMSFNCWGSAATFGSAGSWCGTAGSVGTAGTFGCGGGDEARLANLAGGTMAGGVMNAGGTGWSGCSGLSSTPLSGAAPVRAMAVSEQDMRFNCWGSAATFGSAGSWCGTAGSIGTAGSFGCGGGDDVKLANVAGGTMAGGVLAGGATGARMSVNAMAPTQDMRFNCVGSFGTVGSVGSWCGTAGSAATAGTFGSAVTVDQSTMNAGTSGSFGSVGVTSTPLSGAAQIRSMAPGNQDMRFNCVGSFGTVGSVGSWCGTAGSAATAGTFGSAVTSTSDISAGGAASVGQVSRGATLATFATFNGSIGTGQPPGAFRPRQPSISGCTGTEATNSSCACSGSQATMATGHGTSACWGTTASRGYY